MSVRVKHTSLCGRCVGYDEKSVKCKRCNGKRGNIWLQRIPQCHNGAFTRSILQCGFAMRFTLLKRGRMKNNYLICFQCKNGLQFWACKWTFKRQHGKQQNDIQLYGIRHHGIWHHGIQHHDIQHHVILNHGIWQYDIHRWDIQNHGIWQYDIHQWDIQNHGILNHGILASRHSVSRHSAPGTAIITTVKCFTEQVPVSGLLWLWSHFVVRRKSDLDVL